MIKFDDNKLNKELAGKTIERMFYMSDEQSKLLGFSNCPIIVKFTDGTCLIPLNDEFNNGSSLCCSLPSEQVGKTYEFFIPSKVVEQ